jgi:hypothetical protein
LSTVRDAIKKDWLARWKERLGNRDVTPRQVMRTYVKNLDIMVAHLNSEMGWGCWDNNNYDQDHDYTSK